MKEQTDQNLREELLLRADTLVNRARKLIDYTIDAAYVGNYVVEHIRGIWIYYYDDCYDSPSVIYAKTVSGDVIIPGTKKSITNALNTFRFAMILDDLANI
jgi:hypothetical protein